MGKKTRRIIGIIAAIAIPYVAPIIAKSAALASITSSIGLTAASAATGAVLGAGAAAIGGTDIGRGALMGGIGGGIAGYTAGPTAAAPAAPAADTYGALSITPTLTPGTTYDAFGNVIPSAATTVTPVTYAAPGISSIQPTTMGDISQGISYYGMEPTSAASFGGAPPPTSPAARPADLGTQLSSTGRVPPGGDPSVDAMQSAYMTSPPTTTAATTGGFTYDAFGSVVPAGGEAGGAVAGLQPGGNLVSSPGVVPITAAAAKPTTFMEALRQVPGEIAAKFKDPKALADLTLRAAGSLGTAALAGDGMSPEEQSLLQAQREELEWLRENNPEAYEMRLRESQKLLGMSDYFDPEYFGLQRARAAQIRGARGKRAGLRGLTGQARAVAERQMDIATGRETGTAFDVGAQSALQGRIQTQQAGLQFMPTPSNFATPFGPLQSAYSAANERRRQTARDASELFGSITGIPQSRSLG